MTLQLNDHPNSNGRPHFVNRLAALPPATAPGQFEVDFIGPPFSGKSVLAATLYSSLTRSRDHGPRVTAAAGGILRQVEQLNDHRLTLPTVSGADKEKHADAAQDQLEGLERVSFSWPDVNITFTSRAGQELKSTRGFQVENLLEEFLNHPNKIAVIVLNPFACDRRLAQLAYRDLVASIQAKLGVNFRRGCEIAAATLFHISPEQLAKLNLGFDQTSQLPENAKLVYNPAEPKRTARFKLVPPDPEMESTIFEMMNKISNWVADHTQSYVTPLVPMVDQLYERSIVVFTHLDLMEFCPSVRDSDLWPIFNRIFPERDPYMSQLVFGRNLVISLRDNLEPVFVEEIQDHSIAVLFQSIRTRINAIQEDATLNTSPGQRRVYTEDTDPDMGDLARETAYHGLRFFPLLAWNVLITSAWLAPTRLAFFTQFWTWLAWGTVGLFGLSTLYTWLRWQLFAPRWQVESIGDGKRRLRLKPVLGQSAEAAAWDVHLQTSVLGKLLDCSWLRIGRNRIRRFLIARRHRLLEAAKVTETFRAVLPEALIWGTVVLGLLAVLVVQIFIK